MNAPSTPLNAVLRGGCNFTPTRIVQEGENVCVRVLITVIAYAFSRVGGSVGKMER
jgi:glycine cleavage system regulatory protein